MSQLMLTITTPEKLFFSGNVEALTLTTTEGEMGVLPNHISMVVALETAPVKMKTETGWREAAISGGFAQIKGDQTVILADAAEWPEEIEANRALEAKKRAEERLQAHLSEVEYLQSQVALRRAMTRLSVAKKK